MTSPYSDYKSKFTSGGGDGLFLRIDSDSTVKVRIFSTAYYNLSEYEDRETGEKTYSDKYSWVVWNYDEDKAQIMNFGKSVFNQIAELAEDSDWGDPTTYDIKISKTGKMLETRYSVVPSPAKGTLSEEQVAQLETIDIKKAVKGAISIEQRLTDGANNKSGIEEFFSGDSE